jgi:MFS superfamily sulfate permease-like transporter
LDLALWAVEIDDVVWASAIGPSAKSASPKAAMSAIRARMVKGFGPIVACAAFLILIGLIRLTNN